MIRENPFCKKGSLVLSPKNSYIQIIKSVSFLLFVRMTLFYIE